MSIQHGILGFLSWRPASGYDLKKHFADDPTHYWSGNNNQIYRGLVDLHDKGLVSRQVEQQEHLPARKIYAMTPAGAAALREWVLSDPDLPQLRHTFLVQLAWADQLDPAELDDLLRRYEAGLKDELLLLQEQQRRGRPAPDRTARENALWAAIQNYWLAFYENEIAWVRALGAQLGPPGADNEPEFDN